MLQLIAALSLFTDLADPQERESCNLPQAKYGGSTISNFGI